MLGSFWYEVGRASSNYQITRHVQHLSAMVHFESESTMRAGWENMAGSLIHHTGEKR